MYANAVLARLCAEAGLRFRSFHVPNQFDDDLPRFVSQNAVDVISYIEADWEYVSDMEDFLGVHVIRDPRDILVSAYFSHLNSHHASTWPALQEHREKLQRASKEEGLYLEMEFSAYVFRAMQEWDYEREEILELRFEQLARDPYRFWLRTMEHLSLLDRRPFGLRRTMLYALRGLVNQAETKLPWWIWRTPMQKVPAQRLLGVAYDNRFSKHAEGREQGEEDAASHYRKGQPGDWKNHLTPEHRSELNRRFPRLLAKTGYGDGASAQNQDVEVRV